MAEAVFECDGVLFDMDGTLVDSRQLVERMWLRWADEHGLSRDRVLAHAHGRRTLDTMRLIAPELATPNLMVESSIDDVADMMTALSFHVGEVQRNPYHLLVPAWMQDNVRRGGELVGGQGGAAPDFSFCTLYRLRRWANGRLEKIYEGGRSLPASESAASALASS